MSADDIKASVVEDIKAGMRIAKIDQSMLAARLKTSPPYITKILKGEQNFTIETMDQIATALGLRLKIELSL